MQRYKNLSRMVKQAKLLYSSIILVLLVNMEFYAEKHDQEM